MPKSVFLYLVNDGPVTLWGLSSQERLKRMAIRAGNISFLDKLSNLPAGSSVLLLRCDFVYDERIIKRLLQEENTLLEASINGANTPVTALLDSEFVIDAEAVLSKNSSKTEIPGVSTVQLQQWSSGFQEQLRKFDPPYVLPITEDKKQVIEEHLYSCSYKGVTDLVTKWAWPIPAKWIVQVCVKADITPNTVTILSVILTIIAGAYFAYGQYLPGLVAGWLMTFLDTVDGKLARVTVTSSKIGHILDHGLDIIHPPLWYIAWGMGLSNYVAPKAWLSLDNIYWIILAAYIAGRVYEGLFQLWIGKFGLYCWQPFDSFNRLITARRNPCLILLSTSLVMGQPAAGLLAVLAWTVVSTLVVFTRANSAFAIRLISGKPIRPWLADIGTVIDSNSLAARIFTRPPLTSTMH